jgi:hypothetical protein
MVGLNCKKCHRSPTSPASARFSWASSTSSKSSPGFIAEYGVVSVVPRANTRARPEEVDRIDKARERLARRTVELETFVLQCNEEMDIIRRKLCKDLGVMEVIKQEIEKAGTGPTREQLELDFHNGIRCPRRG